MAREAWKAWAVPAKAAPDARRHPHLTGGGLHLLYGFAERFSRQQIERDGHRGELALVIDGQRGGVALETGEGAQGNHGPVGAADINVAQGIRVLPIFRGHLHDHVVLV